jgi:DNA mismatch repair protein MSH6
MAKLSIIDNDNFRYINTRWVLKSDHYDTVLFFKMGKFYELFHMDAVISVERCGLLFMKRLEMAHSGFPEVAFERYAEVLVGFGYKVGRIEQTETPAENDIRVKAMSRPTTKFDKVVLVIYI